MKFQACELVVELYGGDAEAIMQLLGRPISRRKPR
jgi:hypothetical protein